MSHGNPAAEAISFTIYTQQQHQQSAAVRLHGRSSTNAFGSCNSIKIPLSYIITIIITIKDIYIAQVRKGRKCAMSAEMAVWLCNCLCISHVLCLCTYTVQRTSLHRYSLDSSYPSISAACTQAVGDINNICCPRRGCTSWSYQLIAIKQQTSCTSLPLWIDMTRTDRETPRCYFSLFVAYSSAA